MLQIKSQVNFKQWDGRDLKLAEVVIAPDGACGFRCIVAADKIIKDPKFDPNAMTNEQVRASVKNKILEATNSANVGEETKQSILTSCLDTILDAANNKDSITYYKKLPFEIRSRCEELNQKSKTCAELLNTQVEVVKQRLQLAGVDHEFIEKVSRQSIVDGKILANKGEIFTVKEQIEIENTLIMAEAELAQNDIDQLSFMKNNIGIFLECFVEQADYYLPTLLMPAISKAYGYEIRVWGQVPDKAYATPGALENCPADKLIKMYHVGGNHYNLLLDVEFEPVKQAIVAAEKEAAELKAAKEKVAEPKGETSKGASPPPPPPPAMPMKLANGAPPPPPPMPVKLANGAPPPVKGAAISPALIIINQSITEKIAARDKKIKQSVSGFFTKEKRQKLAVLMKENKISTVIAMLKAFYSGLYEQIMTDDTMHMCSSLLYDKDFYTKGAPPYTPGNEESEKKRKAWIVDKLKINVDKLLINSSISEQAEYINWKSLGLETSSKYFGSSKSGPLFAGISRIEEKKLVKKEFEKVALQKQVEASLYKLINESNDEQVHDLTVLGRHLFNLETIDVQCSCLQLAEIKEVEEVARVVESYKDYQKQFVKGTDATPLTDYAYKQLVIFNGLMKNFFSSTSLILQHAESFDDLDNFLKLHIAAFNSFVPSKVEELTKEDCYERLLPAFFPEEKKILEHKYADQQDILIDQYMQEVSNLGIGRDKLKNVLSILKEDEIISMISGIEIPKADADILFAKEEQEDKKEEKFVGGLKKSEKLLQTELVQTISNYWDQLSLQEKQNILAAVLNKHGSVITAFHPIKVNKEEWNDFVKNEKVIALWGGLLEDAQMVDAVQYPYAAVNKIILNIKDLYCKEIEQKFKDPKYDDALGTKQRSFTTLQERLKECTELLPKNPSNQILKEYQIKLLDLIRFDIAVNSLKYKEANEKYILSNTGTRQAQLELEQYQRDHPANVRNDKDIETITQLKQKFDRLDRETVAAQRNSNNILTAEKQKAQENISKKFLSCLPDMFDSLSDMERNDFLKFFIFIIDPTSIQNNDYVPNVIMAKFVDSIPKEKFAKIISITKTERYARWLLADAAKPVMVGMHKKGKDIEEKVVVKDAEWRDLLKTKEGKSKVVDSVILNVMANQGGFFNKHQKLLRSVVERNLQRLGLLLSISKKEIGKFVEEEPELKVEMNDLFGIIVGNRPYLKGLPIHTFFSSESDLSKIKQGVVDDIKENKLEFDIDIFEKQIREYGVVASKELISSIKKCCLDENFYSNAARTIDTDVVKATKSINIDSAITFLQGALSQQSKNFNELIEKNILIKMEELKKEKFDLQQVSGGPQEIIGHKKKLQHLLLVKSKRDELDVKLIDIDKKIANCKSYIDKLKTSSVVIDYFSILGVNLIRILQELAPHDSSSCVIAMEKFAKVLKDNSNQDLVDDNDAKKIIADINNATRFLVTGTRGNLRELIINNSGVPLTFVKELSGQQDRARKLAYEWANLYTRIFFGEKIDVKDIGDGKNAPISINGFVDVSHLKRSLSTKEYNRLLQAKFIKGSDQEGLYNVLCTAFNSDGDPDKFKEFCNNLFGMQIVGIRTFVEKLEEQIFAINLVEKEVFNADKNNLSKAISLLSEEELKQLFQFLVSNSQNEIDKNMLRDCSKFILQEGDEDKIPADIVDGVDIIIRNVIPAFKKENPKGSFETVIRQEIFIDVNGNSINRQLVREAAVGSKEDEKITANTALLENDKKGVNVVPITKRDLPQQELSCFQQEEVNKLLIKFMDRFEWMLPQGDPLLITKVSVLSLAIMINLMTDENVALLTASVDPNAKEAKALLIEAKNIIQTGKVKDFCQLLNLNGNKKLISKAISLVAKESLVHNFDIIQQTCTEAVLNKSFPKEQQDEMFGKLLASKFYCSLVDVYVAGDDASNAETQLNDAIFVEQNITLEEMFLSQINGKYLEKIGMEKSETENRRKETAKEENAETSNRMKLHASVKSAFNQAEETVAQIIKKLNIEDKLREIADIEILRTEERETLLESTVSECNKLSKTIDAVLVNPSIILSEKDTKSLNEFKENLNNTIDEQMKIINSQKEFQQTLTADCDAKILDLDKQKSNLMSKLLARCHSVWKDLLDDKKMKSMSPENKQKAYDISKETVYTEKCEAAIKVQEGEWKDILIKFEADHNNKVYKNSCLASQHVGNARDLIKKSSDGLKEIINELGKNAQDALEKIEQENAKLAADNNIAKIAEAHQKIEKAKREHELIIKKQNEEHDKRIQAQEKLLKKQEEAMNEKEIFFEESKGRVAVEFSANEDISRMIDDFRAKALTFAKQNNEQLVQQNEEQLLQSKGTQLFNTGNINRWLGELEKNPNAFGKLIDEKEFSDALEEHIVPKDRSSLALIGQRFGLRADRQIIVNYLVEKYKTILQTWQKQNSDKPAAPGKPPGQ